MDQGKIRSTPRPNRRGVILALLVVGLLLVAGLALLVIGLCAPPSRG
jgi:hypothetical protein